MAVEEIPQAGPKRSIFVTAIAWMFIISAGFATLGSLLQNIIFNLLFPFDWVLANLKAGQQMPPALRFILANARIFLLLYLIAAITLFVSSIGLLWRRNWARILFITLLGLGIIGLIGGIFLQYIITAKIPPMPEELDMPMINYQVVLTIIRTVSSIIAAGMCVFFTWIIKKLASPAVKEEFTRRFS